MYISETYTNDTLNEDFFRGASGEILRSPKQMGNVFKSIGDLFSNAQSLMKRVDSMTSQIKHDIERKIFHGSTIGGYIKWRQTTIYWRMYYLLDDKAYNKILNDAKSGSLDKKFFDFKLTSRNVPMITQARSKEELIRAVDLYRDRAYNLYSILLKWRRENNEEMVNILTHYLRIINAGLYDMSEVINIIIDYSR